MQVEEPLKRLRFPEPGKEGRQIEFKSAGVLTHSVFSMGVHDAGDLALHLRVATQRFENQFDVGRTQLRQVRL